MDHLGFGLSSKPKKEEYTYSINEQTDILLKAIERLNINSANILSHDMGDTISTELLTRQNLGLLPKFFKGGLSFTFTNGG